MCVSPLYRRPEKYRERSFVPCGRCYQCVRQKKQDWCTRLSFAQQWADCSFFKLLTYDEEHVPTLSEFTRELAHEHIYRFLQVLKINLVRKFHKDIKLKYFIASELGEEKNRPHYHACIFIKGIKLTWQEANAIFNKFWKHGYVGNCYPLTAQRIRYACKYIQKQYNFKFYSHFSLVQIVNFKDIQRMFYKYVQAYVIANSYDFNKENYDKVIELLSVPVGGKLTIIPAYWRRLFEQHHRNITIYKYGCINHCIGSFLSLKYTVTPESEMFQIHRNHLKKQCLAENKELRDLPPIHLFQNKNYDLCQYSTPLLEPV